MHKFLNNILQIISPFHFQNHDRPRNSQIHHTYKMHKNPDGDRRMAPR